MSPKKIVFAFVVPILIIIFIGVFFVASKKNMSKQDVTGDSHTSTTSLASSAASSTTQVSPQASGGLPVSADDPNVQNVLPNYSATLIRYSFTGTIAELTPTKDGIQMNFKNQSTVLPVIMITKDTRVSKITGGKVTAITSADLKTGLVVDITMDYEKTQKVWYLRDIFVPTDRNAQLK
jgi:guanyl-specific ribonuclease Sa